MKAYLVYHNMNTRLTWTENTTYSTVLIVGRANVGKSTLFNRIVGERDAIVDNQPGITRDIKYRMADWAGKAFFLADSGGFFGPDEDPLTPYVQEQLERASKNASVMLLVLDGRSGPTPLDHEIVNFLRRLKRPILGAINKVDAPKNVDEQIAPFYELGLEDLCPVSAQHGLNIGDLLDLLIQYIPDEVRVEDAPKLPGIAIIGRPNVGKSTLLNAICGSERSLVSPIAGTTRDPVDTEVEVNGKHYLLVDTAGIKRRGKMSQGVDYYSLLRAEEAIQRSDIALLLIDAIEGLTETDAKVFGVAHQQGKAAILLVNKWDAVEKDEKTAGTFAKDIRERLPFLHYAPIEFISALTHQRVQRIFPHVDEILQNYYFRVSTGELNRLMESIQAKNPPPIHKGRSPRIYYWTQAGVAPPTFVAFCSDPKAIHFSYQRYLTNRLYETFEFKGTPIRLVLKQRQSKYQ